MSTLDRLMLGYAFGWTIVRTGMELFQRWQTRQHARKVAYSLGVFGGPKR